MRELIGRFAATDGDVATALRVIAHFDGLVDRHASTAAILRAAAALTETPAGLFDAAANRTIRVDPSGASLSGSAPDHDVDWPRVAVDRAHATSVWLERDDAHRPLDQFVLERCAHALRVRMGGAELLTVEDLVRTACDADVTDGERSAALDALHLPQRVTVVAATPAAVPAAKSRALLGQVWVALQSAREAVEVPRVGRCGTAVVVGGDVAQGLERAQQALALAVDPSCGEPSLVAFEELGGLATVAAVLSPAEAAADRDVAAVQRLRAQRPWVPAVLSRMAAGMSLREAARELHLHHSSLQDRVMWLELRLGYCLQDPPGRLRAATTWSLWRVSGLLG